MNDEPLVVAITDSGVTGPAQLAGRIRHIVCVGLPIALLVRRYSR